MNSDSVLDTLSQYELVCEAGRKDTPGRPLLYRTTSNFLGYFGLNSVEDLPRLDAVAVDETEVQAEVPPVQQDPQHSVPSESTPADVDEQPRP